MILKDIQHGVYKLHPGDPASQMMGLSMFDAPPRTNAGKMAATFTISTSNLDRSRDSVRTTGIDLTDHRRLPIALLNHNKQHPIGRTCDPLDTYTVKMIGDSRLDATIFFHRGTLLGEQSFRLVEERVLCGASIGFIPRPGAIIKSIGSDGHPMTRYEACSLIEVSVVGIPDNQECVLRVIEKGLGSKQLCPELKAHLTPMIEPRPASVVSGFTPEVVIDGRRYVAVDFGSEPPVVTLHNVPGVTSGEPVIVPPPDPTPTIEPTGDARRVFDAEVHREVNGWQVVKDEHAGVCEYVVRNPTTRIETYRHGKYEAVKQWAELNSVPFDSATVKSWDESKHERDHGKFSSTGGASGESKPKGEERRKVPGTIDHWLTRSDVEKMTASGRPVPPVAYTVWPELKPADGKPGHAIRDVTPAGYGPGPSTADSRSTSSQDFHQLTEESKLRSSINEGETLLKGKVAGDKRKAIQRSVDSAKSKLAAMKKPSDNRALSADEIDQPYTARKSLSAPPITKTYLQRMRIKQMPLPEDDDTLQGGAAPVDDTVPPDPNAAQGDPNADPAADPEAMVDTMKPFAQLCHTQHEQAMQMMQAMEAGLADTEHPGARKMAEKNRALLGKIVANTAKFYSEYQGEHEGQPDLPGMEGIETPDGMDDEDDEIPDDEESDDDDLDTGDDVEDDEDDTDDEPKSKEKAAGEYMVKCFGGYWDFIHSKAFAGDKPAMDAAAALLAKVAADKRNPLRNEARVVVKQLRGGIVTKAATDDGWGSFTEADLKILKVS